MSQDLMDETQRRNMQLELIVLKARRAYGMRNMGAHPTLFAALAELGRALPPETPTSIDGNVAPLSFGLGGDAAAMVDVGETTFYQGIKPPLCPVHQALEDKNALEVEVGNDCVACSLHERGALLHILAVGVVPDTQMDTVTALRNLKRVQEVAEEVYVERNYTNPNDDPGALHRKLIKLGWALKVACGQLPGSFLSEVEGLKNDVAERAWRSDHEAFHRGVDAAKDAIRAMRGDGEIAQYKPFFITEIARRCGTPKAVTPKSECACSPCSGCSVCCGSTETQASAQ